MKPGNKFNPSQWDFNKVDKSNLTPEQIKYAVEQYFWRTKDSEMKKQYELWSNYQQNVNASQKADPKSDIAASTELPEVTITMAKPNYIDQMKSGIRNKWTNMSTEDKVHAGIDAATTIGGFVPGVDVVADGVDLLHSLQRKDWAGAGIGAAAMALPVVSAPMLRKIKNTVQLILQPKKTKKAKALVGALSSTVSRFIPQDWYKEESIGLGNVKPHQHFNKEQIDQFGFDQFIPKVFWNKDRFKKSEDPAFSGIITFKTFISNLDKAKDLYPELNNESLYEHIAALAHNQGFDNLTVEYNRSKKLKQSPEEKKFFSMSDRDMHNRLINNLASKFSKEELGLLKSYLFNQGYSKFVANILSGQAKSISSERVSQIKKAIAEFGNFYPLALLSGMYTPYSYADKTIRYFPSQSTFKLGGKLNYLNLMKNGK